MKSILIVLDTLRRDALAAYDNTWIHTPNISRLAACGTTYDNHWVGSLPCMPARREFMTGRHNFLFRGWGPIEPFDDVLPCELGKSGVFSHLITDHYHYFELGGENYHTAFNTWEFFRGQESDPWVSLVDALALPEHIGQARPQNLANRTRMQNESDFSGPQTVASAIDWLNLNRDADDWFLQVELFDPHEPFHCTDEYKAMYGATWDGPLNDWPAYGTTEAAPEALDHIQKCYAGLVTMTDRHIGRLFDALEEHGLFDDTLIILTTDHGTLLGEKRLWMKNWMPCYNEIARIPLIVHWPGQQNDERSTRLTQTIDIMPTLLQHHGAPLPPHVSGKALQSEATHEDIIFGYFGMALNITDGREVYFRNPVRDDLGPLHTYTSMPVAGLKSWFPRDLYEKIEMGRYFGHTYNLPLYKIPAHGRAPRDAENTFINAHQLFDLSRDAAQETPLQNSEREAYWCARIQAHLGRNEAPPEQWLRLGLAAEE
jgi:arylsulfatase A-like enzyme